MSEFSGNDGPPQSPEGKTPAATFGVDTLKSVTPKSKSKLAEEAKAEGAGGNVIKFPTYPPPGDLVLINQEPLPTKTIPETPIPVIKPDIKPAKKPPLKPGDPFQIHPGVVHLDENGNEIGTQVGMGDNTLVKIIRPEDGSAPIFISRTPEGEIIRTKKIGNTWLGHKHK